MPLWLVGVALLAVGLVEALNRYDREPVPTGCMAAGWGVALLVVSVVIWLAEHLRWMP